MQASELLQHCRQLLSELKPLELEADRSLMADPGRAQERYKLLFERSNELLSVPDFALLLEVLKLRAHVCWGAGHTAMLLGNHDFAIQAFNAALMQIVPSPDPSHVGPLQGLGQVYQQIGQSERAREYYYRAYEEARALLLWNDAVQARMLMAQCDFNLGNRDAFLAGLQEARDLADKKTLELQKAKHQVEMHELQFHLTLDPTGEFLHNFSNKEFLTELLQDSPPEEKIEKLSLAGNAACQKGKHRLARDLLNEAIGLAEEKELLDYQWGVLTDLARLYDSWGRLKDAIGYAEKAVEVTRKLPPKLGKAPLGATLHSLISLRYRSDDPQQYQLAAKDFAEFKGMGNNTDVVSLLAARMMGYYKQKRYEEALQTIEEAEQGEVELEIRRRMLMPKTAMLQALGRMEEALVVNLQAIEWYRTYLGATDQPSIPNWSDMLRELGSFYSSTALITAKLGRTREALEWIDRASAQILRSQLAQSVQHADADSHWLDSITFSQIRDLLTEDKVALATYTLGVNGGSIYIYNAAQPESEPQRIALDFTSQELQKLLPGTQQGYAYNSDPFIELLPLLSEKLLHPLREVVNNCEVLCIVPNSLLAAVPFAALTCEDANGDELPLIEHCALAYIPAAAILRWCRQRHAQRQASCLALGVGSADVTQQERIPFAPQAEEVAALFGEQGRNLPESTPFGSFLEEASRYSIVHLACHGSIDKDESNTLLASVLAFADKNITAQDVFASRLEAELVFLNSCLSGDFQSRLVREVGGFWQAFLYAGARTLIAPQIKVHPVYAQEMAVRFYQEWLKGGATKAQALRQAQLEMRARGVETVHWSHHILVGDYR